MALGKGGLCRVPRIRRSAKRIFEFFLEIFSLPSAFTGALGKDILKKILNLCRAPCQGHSVKIFFFSKHSAKKDVAEHRYAGQPMSSAALLPRAWHSANKSFAECLALGEELFAECPIFDTRQRSLHSAKAVFPVVRVLIGLLSHL